MQNLTVSATDPLNALPCYFSDCQLREQDGHGHGSAAALPGDPGVHGAQQSGSLPQGGTRDHHWTAYPASSGVRERNSSFLTLIELAGF